MRILHVVRSDGFGGVERHVAVLATAQLEAGHQVAVVGGPGQAMAQELPGAVSWAPADSLPKVAAALLRWRGADVVHAHMTAAELAAVATTPVGVPVVATRHFASRRGSSRAGSAVAPIIRRRVAAQIAISHYVAERIDGSAAVVYPGVRAQPQFPQVPREPWLLAAQRLEAEKGVDQVIQAFARSGVAQRSWRLVIAGDGSLRGALEALANRLGVRSAVDFVGHRDDVAAWMSRASVYISGCPVEGLGLAVVEAMALRLPVVATAAGGHLETVGLASEDFLFEPGDVDTAARALTKLVEDQALREGYGAALQRVQQQFFTPEEQERGTRRVYEEVLA